MMIQKLAYDLFTLSQICGSTLDALASDNVWLDSDGRAYHENPTVPSPVLNVFKMRHVQFLHKLIANDNAYPGGIGFDELCNEIYSAHGSVRGIRDEEKFVVELMKLTAPIPQPATPEPGVGFGTVAPVAVAVAVAPVAVAVAPVAPKPFPHVGQLINITGKGFTVEKAIVLHVHNGKMWVDMYDNGGELIHMVDVTITPWVEKTPEELRTEALVKLLESRIDVFDEHDELVNEINALFEGDE